ncbi:Uncharacterized protein TCM_006989 [Theobroma cacao]|uniref:Uncharacterized protein n=1 Tax=Theobroma cacao TaxID=3641 RepID=A0A061E1J8_THECC|nr:Uncharacterized protein TCM_006989 [Theobroma cacao]
MTTPTASATTMTNSMASFSNSTQISNLCSNIVASPLTLFSFPCGFLFGFNFPRPSSLSTLKDSPIYIPEHETPSPMEKKKTDWLKKINMAFGNTQRSVCLSLLKIQLSQNQVKIFKSCWQQTHQMFIRLN